LLPPLAPPTSVRLIPLLVASLWLVSPSAADLAAQSSAPGPGVVVNGQISVLVHVTLSDSADPYRPVDDHALTLYRSTGDSIELRTDDAGVLRFLVSPGSYRLTSVRPVPFHGRSYRWAVPLEVRAGMGLVQLTVANATAVEPELADLRGNARTARGAAPPIPGGGGKHASTAVVLNFFLPGVGQMYAGRGGKGAVLLLTSTFTSLVGIAAASASQSAGEQDKSNTGADLAAVAGIGIGVGTWVYSMVSAPSDVRAWNERHGLASVTPTLRRMNGRAAVGLAFAY
jgi:hypothetical protein